MISCANQPAMRAAEVRDRYPWPVNTKGETAPACSPMGTPHPAASLTGPDILEHGMARAFFLLETFDSGLVLSPHSDREGHISPVRRAAPQLPWPPDARRPTTRCSPTARSFGSHAADRPGGTRAPPPPLTGWSTACSTRLEPEMRIEPRIAQGGGRGGQQRRFARGLRCGRRRSGSGSTRGRVLRLTPWHQHSVPRRKRRAMSRRCG